MVFFTLFINAAHSSGDTDEVVVTGLKREQNKTQVPESVSVFNSNEISARNIDSFEDVVNNTENLHLTESGQSTQLRIRGIGSGNSQGFEQSVAQYQDGVFMGRPQLFRVPLYDLSSIEVYRGVQNTMFGKDSIGGAIAIKTQDPTSKFGGAVSVSYIPEFNRKLIDGAVTGSVTDSLSLRIAGRYMDDDGYYTNTLSGSPKPNRNDDSVRFKALWTPTDDLEVLSKIEHSKVETTGRPWEIIQDLPSKFTLDLIAKKPGNETLKAVPSTYSNIMNVLLKQPSFEANENYEKQANEEYSTTELNNFTTSLNYNLENSVLHSTLAKIDYDINETHEGDYIPARLFNFGLDEKYNQYSFDTYLRNKENQNINWLVGLYLQKSEINFHDRFVVPKTSPLGLLGSPLPGTGADRLFNQEENTEAVYSEVSFNLSKSTTIVFEARYSETNKQASKVLNLINDDGSILNNPLMACIYLSQLKAETAQAKGIPYNCLAASPDTTKISGGHTLEDEVSNGTLSPSVSLKQQFTEGLNGFINLKRGHKSGGFDPRSNSASSFQFEGETSNSIEIGLNFSTQKFQSSLVIFKTRYNDLQVSQFDGGLGFNVGNAKLTDSVGAEIETKYQFDNGFSLFANAGLIDIEYKDFKNGNCYYGQVPNGADLNGDGTPDLCDYTGETPTFTPKETLDTGISWKGRVYTGELSIDLYDQFVGRHIVHENLDPHGTQDSYNLVNLSISYNLGNYEFFLKGHNLLNEYVLTYAANVPLSSSSFGTNTLYGFAKEPRNTSVGMKINF